MDQRARSTNIKHEPYVDDGRALSWASFANYYFLAFFVGVFVFVIVLALLRDGYDESPWIVATMASVVSVVSFVLFREVVLRRSRERELAAKRLAHQLGSVRRHTRSPEARDKLSLEQNEKLLREIRKKSDAAKVLGNLANAHREVFELCDDYLILASRELSTARPGSPRIPALRRGAVTAAKRHRFHMLRWAEVKSHAFTDAANSSETIVSKIDSAEQALGAVEKAIEMYPGEKALADSREVLQVFLTSTRLKSSLVEAEEAESKGDLERALRSYENALAELNVRAGNLADTDVFETKVRSEIERIRILIEDS